MLLQAYLYNHSLERKLFKYNYEEIDKWCLENGVNLKITRDPPFIDQPGRIEFCLEERTTIGTKSIEEISRDYNINELNEKVGNLYETGEKLKSVKNFIQDQSVNFNINEAFRSSEEWSFFIQNSINECQDVVNFLEKALTFFYILICFTINSYKLIN